MCIHVYMTAHAHTHRHSYIRAYTFICMLIRIHTHRHTHKYTHTREIKETGQNLLPTKFSHRGINLDQEVKALSLRAAKQN